MSPLNVYIIASLLIFGVMMIPPYLRRRKKVRQAWRFGSLAAEMESETLSA